MCTMGHSKKELLVCATTWLNVRFQVKGSRLTKLHTCKSIYTAFRKGKTNTKTVGPKSARVAGAGWGADGSQGHGEVGGDALLHNLTVVVVPGCPHLPSCHHAVHYKRVSFSLCTLP